MDTTAIDKVIASRRTVKPTNMNGQKIEDTTVQTLLQLADWAPTHGYTEPWYFVVFSGDKVQQFCNDHAQMYKDYTPADKYMGGNYEKLKHQGDLASHVIGVCMKRGNNPKIPAQEEMAAVACAAENLLLGATARGIASYWGSGGMTYHPAMHEYFGLGENDSLLGFIYLGYTSDPLPEGRRIKAPAEKFKWM